MSGEPSALGQFETRANFHISVSLPYSVVVGDFNRDGILDLAEVSFDPSGSVEILLGNGDGTFRQGATYAVGVGPEYAATASLRKNGILDLVFSDWLSDEVWVMLGKGDGTFQPAVAYPTTARSYTIMLGDFTGSGNLDIAATEGYNSSGTFDCNCVEVLPGNGDGTFGAPITTTLPYGLTAYVIAAGDFNDDGKLDVAAAGESFPNYEVAILLGNGDGTFDADGHYLIFGAPFSIAAGYFTSSKKKLDLATAPGLGVLLGKGDGTFRMAVAYESDNPLWVIAQDLDGDGKVDMAVSDGGDTFGPSGVTVFRGNGNGTFQQGVFYQAGTDEGGDYVAAGDFNGDGKPDLVVVDETHGLITTLLNTGVVSFSPTTPLNFKKQAVGTTSAAQTVTLTNTGTTELKIQSMKASANFAMTSTCGARVAPAAKCTISATFSPTKQGTKQGTITIIDNASSKAQVIELLGTGT
jgi:hypothetical protein